MKKLTLLLSLLIITMATKAQTFTSLPVVNGKVFYQSIVSDTGKTKDILFYAANKWMADGDTEVKKAISIQHQDHGQIIGKGTFIYDYIRYNFTLQIDCKDNKYRVQLYNITYASSGAKPTPIETYNDGLQYTNSLEDKLKAWNLHDKFQDVLASLTNSIKKGANDEF